MVPMDFNSQFTLQNYDKYLGRQYRWSSITEYFYLYAIKLARNSFCSMVQTFCIVKVFSQFTGILSHVRTMLMSYLCHPHCTISLSLNFSGKLNVLLLPLFCHVTNCQLIVSTHPDTVCFHVAFH